MSDKLNFQADVSKMLDIVVNSLYSEKQIFLRELISNASDACDKLKYMALTHPDITRESGEMKIWITPNAEKNTLTVADNGIGMNRDDLINHLGRGFSQGSRHQGLRTGTQTRPQSRLQPVGQILPAAQ